MDLFDFLDDEFDDFLGNISRLRKHREIRPRINHLVEYDDEQFRSRFRLSKLAFNYVLSLIEDDIKTTTSWNSAISPENRLLLTLNYYATGCFLGAIGDMSGVSKASVSRIVLNVSVAIAKLRPKFVKFPSNLQSLTYGFYNIAKFPRVIGIIGCTHVNIKSPGGENAECYKDRHGNFSMNIQMIVDHDFKIMDIVARWPGSSKKQTIFNNSRIKHRLENKEFPNNMIIGDRGYKNTKYLLTPLHNPCNPAEILYNKSLQKTRNVVERTYGAWKNRFPVLSKKIILHPSRVQAIIVACAVLHNIAIMSGDEHFQDDSEQNHHVNDTHREIDNNLENGTRNNIIEYYESLL